MDIKAEYLLAIKFVKPQLGEILTKAITNYVNELQNQQAKLKAEVNKLNEHLDQKEMNK